MKKLETIVLGSGCFWCVEAIFKGLKGVDSLMPGYMGGNKINPTYKDVCTGTTGHAEVIQLKFDKTIISIDEVLAVFWNTHDPTTLNRQGNDVGTQYRSVIFYNTEEQREIAETYKAQLILDKTFEFRVITEITQSSIFYPGETEHQDYYELNGSERYCDYIIRPKVEKFREQFKDKLKEESI